VIDTFLSGGCSFTEVPTIGAENWPLHLERYLQVNTKHSGLATVGNGFIYKTLIYELSKIENKENLLVGVMWSSANRQMFYNRKDLYLPVEKKSDIYKRLPDDKQIPLKIAGEKAHYLTQPSKIFEYNKFYYTYFYDLVGSYIETIQHILHLQWYLKLNNIKYFMTRFADGCLPDKKDTELLAHPDIDYLYNQIDFTNWLDTYSMLDFCIESKLPYKAPNDLHPSTEQSKLFVEQVVIPHLKNKGYIN
jgi:hypothetical protein